MTWIAWSPQVGSRHPEAGQGWRCLGPPIGSGWTCHPLCTGHPRPSAWSQVLLRSCSVVSGTCGRQAPRLYLGVCSKTVCMGRWAEILVSCSDSCGSPHFRVEQPHRDSQVLKIQEPGQ